MYRILQSFFFFLFFLFFFWRRYLKHTQKIILCGCPDRMSFQAFIGHRLLLLLLLFYTYSAPSHFQCGLASTSSSNVVRTHSTNRSVTPTVGVNRLDFQRKNAICLNVRYFILFWIFHKKSSTHYSLYHHRFNLKVTTTCTSFISRFDRKLAV